MLIVHRSLSKPNGQHSTLQEPTLSHLYAQQHQPPLAPPPHQPFSLVSHQRHPLPPSYPSYQHPIPPPLHPAPPHPPMNALHPPPTASAGISPFQQYPPPPMAAPHGNGNGVIPPLQQPFNGNPIHNAPRPAHANNNNLDIGALNHTIHLLQQLIQQQQSTQNIQEQNATLASIQQTLSSLMLSQQQQLPSQQGNASPSNTLHQLASQLSALATHAAGSSSLPPSSNSMDYPYSGYPPPPASMLQHPHHGPILTATPSYPTQPSPSPTSTHRQHNPTDSSSMIPSVNELLGKIKDLSKQVMPPSSSSSSTRNPRRRK